MRIFALILLAATAAHAQFELQESHTTASLRGIHAVSAEVAWASGTGGTVLRTEDGGKTWKPCAVPEGAEKLDFRGVQAFDAKTALVMSSGTGDLSRIYKTTDGCASWKLVFSNPDKDGFFDAMQFTDRKNGILIGDPVKDHYEALHPESPQDPPHFPLFSTVDGGESWSEYPVAYHWRGSTEPAESLFAASNSSALYLPSASAVFFVTGGPKSYLRTFRYFGSSIPTMCAGFCEFLQQDASKLSSGDAAGGFSIASNSIGSLPLLVLVGGNYKLSDAAIGSAASCVSKPVARKEFPVPAPVPAKTRWSYQCTAAATLPHGYRSSVAYDKLTRAWITVGPNGTDISRDNGKNWQPLRPGKLDKSNVDINWNALSLPFVVGPKGRIGRLRADALVAPVKK